MNHRTFVGCDGMRSISSAARRCSIAGCPVCGLSDETSRRTSACAASSHSRTVRSRREAGSGGRLPANSAATSNPFGSTSHPNRRVATPVMHHSMPYLSRRSTVLSCNKRTKARPTFPKPTRQSLCLFIVFSLHAESLVLPYDCRGIAGLQRLVYSAMFPSRESTSAYNWAPSGCTCPR